MVDLARFERATLTFAESRSVPLSYRSKEIWRKGQGSNLQATMRGSFKTTALPVRLPFLFEDGACVAKHAKSNSFVLQD